MSVFKSLTREHRLFEKLIERLRAASEGAGDEARETEIETLEALLEGLRRHDEVEHALFAAPVHGADAEEKRARQLVDAQHAALELLTADIRALLREKPIAARRLRAMGELLAGRLEWHFRSEEMLLWPLFARTSGRSLAHSLERRAELNARALEQAEAGLARRHGVAGSP